MRETSQSESRKDDFTQERAGYKNSRLGKELGIALLKNIGRRGI